MAVHLSCVPHDSVPHGVYLIAVYLTGVHLMAVYLINVHLKGVHHMGLYLAVVDLSRSELQNTSFALIAGVVPTARRSGRLSHQAARAENNPNLRLRLLGWRLHTQIVCPTLLQLAHLPISYLSSLISHFNPVTALRCEGVSHHKLNRWGMTVRLRHHHGQ